MLLDNRSQFSLLGRRHLELVERLLKVVYERLPFLWRDIEVAIRVGLIKTWLILGGQGFRTLPRGVTLLNPDRITTADCAAPHYGSIHTDVDLVMLGHRAEDPRIP